MAGYEGRIMQAQVERPDLFPRGAASKVDVSHDAWCPMLAGEPCTCVPTITVTGVKGAFVIDAAGHVELVQ